jgi:hypothetical protein
MIWKQYLGFKEILNEHDGWFIFLLVYLNYWYQRLDDMEYFKLSFLILTQLDNW